LFGGKANLSSSPAGREEKGKGEREEEAGRRRRRRRRRMTDAWMDEQTNE